MKRKLTLIASASAASILAFTTLAQDSANPGLVRPDSTGLDRADYGHHDRTQPRANQLNGAAKASELIGMDVKNHQDEELGTVKDLAVDVESGRIVQVILSSGGFIGIGEKLNAVPPGALRHDAAQSVLQLDASQEQWKSAPAFDMSKWAECCDSNHLSTVYGHYGQESAFGFVENGDTNRDARSNYDQGNRGDQSGISGQRETVGQRNENETARRNYEQADRRNQSRIGGQRETVGQRNETAWRGPASRTNTMEQASTDGRFSAEKSPATVTSPRGDSTWDRDKEHMSSERQSMIPASRLGQVQKASDLIGMAVENRQAEKLGDVTDILVDLPSGRIVAVILSSGGFLGMGDELSAVPPTALSFTTAERDTLQLDASKELLSNAPHFKANQWPNFTEPGYAGSVYRAYNVQPYFTTDGTTDADNSRSYVRDRDEQTPATRQPDNTARNARDRNDQTVTPLDQGNSKADVDTTAQIRKEINASENMSVSGKNVKVITRNGQVTLRGPVDNAEEKRLIGEIANRIARSGNVDNQLEVKFTTTSTN